MTDSPITSSTMVEVPCCLCGTAGALTILEADDYVTGRRQRVVRCPSCALVYVSPRPSAEALPHYYPRAHQRSAPAAYERADARPRIRLVRALLEGRPGRILDVGCGKGLLLAGLRDAGWDVHGTELSDVSSAVALAAGITVHTRPLEACPLDPASFDVVTLYHSIEHMLDPLATLRLVRTLVRPRGFVVIEVPNFGSWYARVFGADWFHLDVPRHLYHFTRPTMRRLLAAAELSVVRETTRNVQYDAFGAVQSLLNRMLARKNLLNSFNTRELTFAQLRAEVGRPGALGVIALSEAALAVGFPVFALQELALARWVDGGTLRVVATRDA